MTGALGWCWWTSLSRVQAWAPSLDGVPGRAERRCVGEVEVGDRVDGHVVVDRGGGHVDAFGDLAAEVADELDAEQPAGVRGRRCSAS